MSVQVDASGLTGWSSRLAETLRCDMPGPMQDGMTEALALIMNWEQQEYHQKSTGFGDWLDLAVSTKVHRARKSGAFDARKNRSQLTQAQIAALMNFPILIDTGDLFNSLQQGNPFNEMVYTENSTTQQSVVPYGHWHMTGGSHLPARPFIVPPDDSILSEAAIPIARGIHGAIVLSVLM